MNEFLSTFVFVLPGIMSYFWLQSFGLNPSVKHSAPELSGIAALLWLPVSFVTLLILNFWGKFTPLSFLAVNQVWTVDELNTATSDIKYLVLFLVLSFFVSYFICREWSKWGNKVLQDKINSVRKERKIAPLSLSASVWEEFFIRINKGEEEQKVEKQQKEKDSFGKEAVYLIYKIDNPREFVIGSMTKASRPFEVDKALVLEESQEWNDSLEDNYYNTKRVYIDIKSGMVVKELDHENPKPIPEKNSKTS